MLDSIYADHCYTMLLKKNGKDMRISCITNLHPSTNMNEAHGWFEEKFSCEVRDVRLIKD